MQVGLIIRHSIDINLEMIKIINYVGCFHLQTQIKPWKCKLFAYFELKSLTESIVTKVIVGTVNEEGDSINVSTRILSINE